MLVMTTNHTQRLDAALVRPGRVDQEAALGLANLQMLAEPSRLVLKRSDGDPDHKPRAGHSDTVDLLAKDFAKRVPELDFSPAEIMSFLSEDRQSPRTAVESVQQWMEEPSSEGEHNES